jgi:VanZ family protein
MIKPSLLPAIGWTVLCTILFVLPGSAFPKEDWLSKIWFDKWVHWGLFSVMTVLWCWGLPSKKPLYIILVPVAALIYGILMEFIQLYFVINRSFDSGDIIADAIGCITGYWVYRKYIKK